jgi:hypothetical protein
VRAAFAARKGDDLSLGEIAPAARGSECERAAQNDQELLALKVVVEHH